MSFYRSPALTDSFITGTRRTDGAGFWQSVVVRGYSSPLLGCCRWRGPTDLITLSRSRRFCPSCGLNFLPPTQKEASAQLFHTDGAGGAAIDFQINKSEGRWGGNGLELGWRWKCQVLNVCLFAVSNVKVEPLRRQPFFIFTLVPLMNPSSRSQLQLANESVETESIPAKQSTLFWESV